MTNDIPQILNFLRESRKMLLTYRFTPKPDKGFENDAEHSWSVALICMLVTSRIEKELDVQIDQLKMLKVALIHDMAEIRTGDTKTWDAKARVGKEEREREAFYSMTNSLPADLQKDIRELWEECEKRESIEAMIVKSVDRMDPVLHRTFFDVGWKDIEGQDGSVEALNDRQLPRHSFSEVLTQIYESVRDEAIAKGMFNK